MTLEEAKIIELPKILDKRGNLSIIEEFKNVPFKIERTYWIYDVPGGEIRGGHAYRENQEFIVALSGSFDVVLDDGKVLGQGTHEHLMNTCPEYALIARTQMGEGKEGA